MVGLLGGLADDGGRPRPNASRAHFPSLLSPDLDVVPELKVIFKVMSLIIGGHLITLLITAKGRESRVANSSFCSLE